MRSKKKSGQVLILVLLVVVVSLAIGLSVASRNLTNLKISTQTEQSQRAYSVAENGVESVLSKLKNTAGYASSVANAGPGGVTSVGPSDSTGVPSSVNVVSKASYERSIPLGEVGQVDVNSLTAKQYYIKWAKKTSDNECKTPASLEVTLIYLDTSGNIKQVRWYLVGSPGSHASTEPQTSSVDKVSGALASSFTYAGATSNTSCAVVNTSPSSCFVPGDVYLRCAMIDTTQANLGLVNTPKILRIRPLWADTTANVSAVSGALPAQEYVITSTSTVGNGVTRKLAVTKSVLQSMPAIFDFALYSETGITK